ncbi:PP2C family protein-serine/threonine phosphatase [Klenkia sp. PcliD-1-E]|uniref:PP2C family protein-serine/threonine phosphatase n=1 Tax=Klenkia sp. PcliD-1-E TaxID=2954492 RepID=UPI0027E034CC|nr:PP2C family protein-serine/threonine phosphatase [Klenkia sp. PcliD-1-E]
MRGIATYSDAGPSEVLRGLDTSMRLLRARTMATAVVARLEQTSEEDERGVTRMVWGNAGHPPPVVIHPDASQVVLASRRGQLLLGVDDTTTRTQQVITLDRDATVLLYSDGLVERRDQHLDQGTQRLQQAIAELHGTSLDDLCDGLIDRLVDGRPDDDVALVAVRLFRQDQRRPPEAGPDVVPPGMPPDRPRPADWSWEFEDV